MNKHKSDCICLECIKPPVATTKEIYHEIAMIGEDFMGQGSVDSQLPVMSSRHTMTQLPGQEDRDDLMKPYHFTKDKSSKQSNTMRKKYRAKNLKFAAPKTRLPYGY